MRTALLAAFGLLALAACDVHVYGGGTVSGNLPGLDATATKTEEATLDVKAGDTIDAKSEFGAIHLRVDDAAKPSAKATITIHAKTDDDAKRVLASWKLVVTKTGLTTTLRAEGDALEVEIAGAKVKVTPQVEIEAVVPTGVKVRADSSSGEVRAEGAFGGAELHSSFGRVGCTGVRGDVSAHSDSGSVTVEDVKGAVLDAGSKFGAVQLSKIVADKVKAHSDSGSVSCEVGGRADYELTTSFGAVRVRGGSGSIEAKSNSGGVDVSGFDGKVTAHSDFGKVEVAGVLTSVDATSNSGSVAVDARTGSKADGPWKVKSDFGSVTLRLPDAFACDLDLGTEFGSLTAEHPGLARGPDRGAKEMRAKVGAGGETVVVHTKSGSARVERSSR